MRKRSPPGCRFKQEKKGILSIANLGKILNKTT